MPNINNIVKQLKSRKVFRSLAIYAAFAFVLIQVCSIVFPALYLPEWTMTFVVVLVIIGFPTTLVLSWIYDITPSEGEETPPTEATQPLGVYALTGLVLTVIGIGFWVAVGVFGVSFGGSDEVPSIAIIPFDNKGADEDDFYAYSISSDLISDVAGAGLIRVASIRDIEKLDYTTLNNSELSEKLLVRYIAQGTLWKVDSVFQLSMELYDTKTSKVLWSESWQKEWNEIASIKGNLADNILKTLKVSTKQDFVKAPTTNTEAYEFYLKGKYKYKKRENMEDMDIARGFLKKAFELDNNLIEAKLIFAGTFIDVGEYDKAMNLLNDIKKQSEAYDNNKMLAEVLRYIGIINYMQGEFENALHYYTDALQISEEMDNKNNILKILINISAILRRLGDSDKSLEYINKSLNIAEQLDSKRGIVGALIGIGNIYYVLSNYDQASDYYNRSLKIADLLDEKNISGTIQTNLAAICFTKGDLDGSLNYSKKALKIFTELGDKRQCCLALNNIGNAYMEKRDYNIALRTLQEALQIGEEIGAKRQIASSLSSISRVFLKSGDYLSAIDYQTRSLTIFNEIGEKNAIARCLSIFSSIYSDKGEYNRAMEYSRRALIIREETGDQDGVATSFDYMGYIYLKQNAIDSSRTYFEKSLAIKNNIVSSADELLWSTTNLYLTYKNLGIEYDEKEIHRLIKEIEYVGFTLNYAIYQLLEIPSYLETSYIQVQELADNLEPDVAAKFLSYPIPKAIVEEWEKVK